jgi:DNA-directed RNA polymerase subunit K/omega
MDRTKVMQLADKVGGLFRLTVLLQKRVAELVTGSPKLVDTKETNPIRIAMLEVEADAIDLVDLTDEELAQLEQQTQMATDEAELLEALRSRMTRNLAAPAEPAAGAPYESTEEEDD